MLAAAVSHFTQLQTRITSEPHLVRALADVGYDTVEIHDEPQKLRGYQGDARKQRAHVIVRRRHVGRSSNDIGFVRGEDGSYSAFISEYDRRKHGAEWLAELTQRYAYHVSKDLLEEQGFDLVDEQVEESGTVRLTLRRFV